MCAMSQIRPEISPKSINKLVTFNKSSQYIPTNLIPGIRGATLRGGAGGGGPLFTASAAALNTHHNLMFVMPSGKNY